LRMPTLIAAFPWTAIIRRRGMLHRNSGKV